MIFPPKQSHEVWQISSSGLSKHTSATAEPPGELLTTLPKAQILGPMGFKGGDRKVLTPSGPESPAQPYSS